MCGGGGRERGDMERGSKLGIGSAWHSGRTNTVPFWNQRGVFVEISNRPRRSGFVLS